MRPGEAVVGGAMNEYVICNCCTDGCVPYILNRSLGQGVFPLVRGGMRAAVNPLTCRECGTCVEVCPFSCRLITGGHSTVGDCYGCGLCAARCPYGASRMS